MKKLLLLALLVIGWLNTKMKIKIYYCEPWGFKKEASRIEEELNKNFKETDIKLIEGKLGQYTIYLNDKMIYNKEKSSCQFPTTMEIIDLILNVISTPTRLSTGGKRYRKADTHSK